MLPAAVNNRPAFDLVVPDSNILDGQFLAAVGESLDAYSLVILRGLVPAERVRFFADLYWKIKTALTDELASLGLDYRGDLPPIDQVPAEHHAMYHISRNVKVGQIYPPMFAKHGAPFSIFDLANSKRFHEILSFIFDGSYYEAFNAHTREMSPGHKVEQWTQPPIYMHADAYYSQASHLYGVNCWLADRPVGETAPSIMLLPMTQAESEAVSLYNPETRKFSEERFKEIRDTPGKHLDLSSAICPKLDMGDVIIFSTWCYHATYWTEQMTEGRIGFELRYTGTTRNRPNS